MMHLFVNSLSASAGGGLTYIRNVIPHLVATPHLRITIALNSALKKEFNGCPNIDFVALGDVSTIQRLWYEQSKLPGLIRKSRADVLLSTGNFALRKSPVPQVLLSRNSIYLSHDYSRDLLSRHEYRAWTDMRLRGVMAKRSIEWADITVAPSEAFAAELRRWTGAPVSCVHHGFDSEIFEGDSTALSPAVEEKLRNSESSFKVLFVSHYNYFRNFETLIRALPHWRSGLAGRPVKLLLTCDLSREKRGYRPFQAADMIKELRVSDMVLPLGEIPYQQLHHLYARADVYVTPAYTETFAHPLVEAMFSGLPVAASDIPVHREICGEAALYFERFDPSILAECVRQLSESAEMRSRMATAGRKRSLDFSWKAHVQKILELSRSLIHSRGRPD